MVEMIGLNRPLRQAQLEHRFVRPRQQEQARRHEHRAQQDGTLETDHLVGDVATEDGAGIDQREVGAVKLARRLLAGGIAAMELRHDVQHHRPADAIEREAFPELGHEQHPQRTRMAQYLLEFRNLPRSLRINGTAHAVSPFSEVRMTTAAGRGTAQHYRPGWP
jgi:hypothetical protein